MRLSVTIISLFITLFAAYGQFSAVGNFIVSKPDSLDAAFIFEDINNGKISYTSPISNPNYTWRKYYTPGIGQVNDLITTDLSTNSSTEIDIVDQGEGGYTLEYDSLGINVKKRIWITNYDLYKPQIDSIGVYEDGSPFNTTIDLCMNIILKTYFKTSDIIYYLPNNSQPLTIQKTTSVYYTNFGEESQRDNNQYLQISAPFDDTKFEANVKDLFIAPNGTDKVSLKSEIIDTTYIAKALKMDGINYKIAVDSLSTNEIEQESSGFLGGSAPLETYLTPNNATSKVVYYDWEIWKYTTPPSSKIRYYDREIRHIFRDKVNEDGKTDYYTKLTISNDYCSYSDSIEVKILTSFIDAPNFMLLKEGYPSEFRVAYKSLATFKGYIYNRWGRLLFEWKDPAKGWDATHNGRLVAPGVYYYVIRAKGTDGMNQNKSGSITILRPKN